MDITTRKVLVLNSSYEPINVCAVKRAIVMILKGTAVCEEKSEFIVRSPSTVIPAPEVIRLRFHLPFPMWKRSFSRKNIYIRDNYTCQYCGNRFHPSELTIDHIKPRSRGGKSTWENMVTCCKECNNKKKDLLPQEAKMKLIRKPRSLGYYLHLIGVRHQGELREQWKKYLFYY